MSLLRLQIIPINFEHLWTHRAEASFKYAEGDNLQLNTLWHHRKSVKSWRHVSKLWKPMPNLFPGIFVQHQHLICYTNAISTLIIVTHNWIPWLGVQTDPRLVVGNWTSVRNRSKTLGPEASLANTLKMESKSGFSCPCSCFVPST